MSLGFEHAHRDGAIVVTSVDRDGAAAEAGIQVQIAMFYSIPSLSGSSAHLSLPT
jgi:predicted metalloprotease with PDZ domain